MAVDRPSVSDQSF
jgi:Zn-dependent M16 (insulinase) family peptidase